MEAETPNLPSPELEVVAEPSAPDDVRSASEHLAELGEGWDGLVPDTNGRLHRPDGSFASKAEIEAGRVIPEEAAEEPVVADAAEAPEVPESEEGAEDVVEEEPATPEFKVLLKGHPDRGEEDIELVLPDAEAVERWNRAVNDGLRKKDYDSKVQAVQQEKAEVAEFFTAMEHNPIGTLLHAIPREVSLDVAQALVAEHWDALFPKLQQFSQDPTLVRETRLDSRERSTQADQHTRSLLEAERRAGAILSAVEAIIPDTVMPALRQQFKEDAERDLVKLAQQGVAISPETVAQQLQDRIRMYGFGKQESAAPKKPVVAKRVGMPDSSASAPSVEEAKRKQAQVQNTAQALKAAKALPPKGRGPVATRRSLIPAGSDVETASEHLAKATSWAEFRPA